MPNRSTRPVSRRRPSLPQLRRHKASGQAIVTLAGHDVYLGPHGTSVSRREYDRVIAEYLAAGRRWPPRPTEHAPLDIDDLILRYWEEYVTQHYCKQGQPTAEQGNIRSALRSLRELYGHTPASEFSPLGLKAVRQKFLDRRLSRTTVNRFTNIVRRMFRWATEEELIPAEVYPRLQSVSGLRAGRTDAPEPEPVRPVSETAIDAVLEYVSAPVRAMIQLQRLTGMRPGEVVLMRSADVDISGDIWVYRPSRHKLEHKQIAREVFLGPQAQRLLGPWLRTDRQAYLFQPLEAEQQRNATRRESRQSPLTPSQARRRPQANRQRPPAESYSVDSYRRAIARGCELAFEMPTELRNIGSAVARLAESAQPAARVELRRRAAVWRKEHVWHPNQLRHSAATRIRKAFGLDGAGTILGHKHLSTTEIYAEQDRQAAARIMGQIG